MSTLRTFLDTSQMIADLESASSILEWDQETQMPAGGTDARAEQLATLSTVAHRIKVSASYQAALDELCDEDTDAWKQLGDEHRAIVRETRRTVDRARRLPEEHVAALARATAHAHDDWKRARAASDFSLFADSLRTLIELKRREADLLGKGGDPYDALIDHYEPGMTTAVLRPVFRRLRDGTIALLDRVRRSGRTIDESMLYTPHDPVAQLAFGKRIVAKLGFDFQRGRVDLSAHPFCTSFATTDVRLTTRILEDDLRSCLFGLIHEAGHGMYEQGIDSRFDRTVIAAGASMGIHESQSLFWENMIGRSREFWTWAYPQLCAAFPDRHTPSHEDRFYHAINAVRPSLIRIEADDLTYNLHIMLRFEIEHALINGELDVESIPSTWNRAIEEHLGIVPSNDAEGCLQDVHWSFGGFGYFPSYTLGKLYAAMFYRQAHASIPSLTEKIALGDFTDLLAWLRSSIHIWGKRRTATELVRSITGSEVSEVPFLEHNERKVAALYES